MNLKACTVPEFLYTLEAYEAVAEHTNKDLTSKDYLTFADEKYKMLLQKGKWIVTSAHDGSTLDSIIKPKSPPGLPHKWPPPEKGGNKTTYHYKGHPWYFALNV